GQLRAEFGRMGTLSLPQKAYGLAFAGEHLLVLLEGGDVLVANARTGAADGQPLQAGRKLDVKDVTYDPQRDRVLASGGGMLVTWNLAGRRLEGVIALSQTPQSLPTEGIAVDVSTGKAIATVQG